MLDARLRKNLDIPLLLLTLMVVVVGIITLYSASKDNPAKFYQKQIVWFVMGLICLVAVATWDYSRYPRLVRLLYSINIGMLIVVMRFGSAAKGATRWISIGSFQVQPSEFAKIIMIICLAVYLTDRREDIGKIPVLLGSFLYTALPTFLIFKQPDLGTSLVLMTIWFGMAFIAGAKIKHLSLFFLCGVSLFTIMWKADVLKDYQKKRMVVFLNPEVDPKETGYHVIQSRIAIGSGQLWGKGLGHGTQAHGQFIPENHTDFIFTIVGEEGGFVISVIVVLMYGGLLIRGCLIMGQAEDLLGRLLAAGVVSMYSFHIIVNIGMTVGIMPVTGVPLPLFSYGGSSMLLNMASIGMLLGVGMRKHSLVF